MADTIVQILGDLTGQESPISANNTEGMANKLLEGSGLGYSQFNELLLLLGYDRVQPCFFQFLLHSNKTSKDNEAFHSLNELRVSVDFFRTHAILQFGNVKFAFKSLSVLDDQALSHNLQWLEKVDESKLEKRHSPLVPIAPIPGDDTYYLGYLIERELKTILEKNPNDVEAQQELIKRNDIVLLGKANHNAYLASDHLDVYVATSMRERHEYQIVNKVIDEVFSDPELERLKVRWFDPTQAYCEERIDKGIVEGLMLKRATCTLYLAQESDTLGKDSELASTLAQGKPVIAFIPSVSQKEQDDYVEDLLDMLRKASPHKSDKEIILEQLRIFVPAAAWHDQVVMSWIADIKSMDLKEAKEKLGDCIREHYDKRANTLKESHPLGLQVHLETGVANGVLVARETSECSELIKRILTNTLEFTICEKSIDQKRYLLLKENITRSIFRVVSGDVFLTNTFWNFYLP